MAELVEVHKYFPGVYALQGVSLTVQMGEIHSVVGENGAGKSTLVKLLSGVLRPDGGTVLIDGSPIHLRSPRAARRAGITVLPQDVQAIPTFTAGRNIMLGMEPWLVRRTGLTSRGQEHERVRQALERVGAQIDADRPAHSLSVPEVRLCQLAHVLLHPGKLVVLDEPTAVLSEVDGEALLNRLQHLRDEGKGILYVSHRLGEVLRISDRISVLRDGQLVASLPSEAADRATLVQLMAKKSAVARVRGTSERAEQKGQATSVTPLLRVEDLSVAGAFDRISLEVRRGEVAGVAGVQGAGHGRLLETIAGLVEPDRGHVVVDGHRLPPASVRDARRRGVMLVPADRRRAGVVSPRSLRENIALVGGSGLHRAGVRSQGVERRVAAEHVHRLRIRTSSVEKIVGALSGGNQQKVAIARALQANPHVLLLDEPTQGVDVSSKDEILRLIRAVAEERGCAVLIASSEFDELLEHADVIHVMAAGKLTGGFPRGTATYHDILSDALP